MISFILSYLIPFLILIMIVVFIHEYGHYYFAKKYGVGVTDFSINPHPVEWFGENIDTEEYVRTLSPINYVRIGGAPVITIHGTEDAAVPYGQAFNLHQKLQAAGIKEKLHTVKGKKHGDFSPEELTQIYQEIWGFLESAGIKTKVD